MINHIGSNSTVRGALKARPQGQAKEAQAAPAESARVSGGLNLQEVLASTAAEAARIQSELPEHFPNEVLVKLAPNQGLDDGLQEFAGDYGAKLVEHFAVPENMTDDFAGELVHLKLPQNMSTAQAMAAMAKDGRVAYACSNDVLKLVEPVDTEEPTVTSQETPAEPGQKLPDDLANKLWGLNNTGQTGGKNDVDIDAPEAWTLTTGQREGGPIICVIDTGIDYNHPDLKANLWTNKGEIAGDGIDNDGNGVIDDLHGFNGINDSGNPLDDHNHGSHCFGTIAGVGNNGTGVVGVNWEAQVMGAKFLAANGSGSTAGAIKAVMYASKNGARITSNSWGGGGFNQALYDSMKASPALHIVAAGNESNNNDKKPSYPASYDLPNIVAVAATDSSDRLASFSNYGATQVDLAAPGVGIYSTLKNGGYGSMSGTSMACPHVSGVAGLIATMYPNATNADIKQRLLGGVDPVEGLAGKVATGGRLNAYNSIAPDTTPPAAPGAFTANAGAREARLSWTAPGDDGTAGRATSYELRVSDKPIVEGEPSPDEVGFEQAAKLDAPRPAEAGKLESLTLPLEVSDQPRSLHFALRAVDNAGNVGPVSSVQANIPPAIFAFKDDAESGTAKWTPEGTWGQVEVPGHGQVWTDSPAGNYVEKTEYTLQSQPISLKGLHGARLDFDAKWDMEQKHDQLVVEVDNGGWWNKEVATFTGQSDWGHQTLDLSKFDGQDIKLRFKMEADKSNNGDGVYLDNVVLTAEKSGTGVAEPASGCFKSVVG